MSGQHELGRALARLELNRDGIPWMERRALAASLGDALGKPGAREVAIRLVTLLADDAKWEVRREIASLLVALPNDEFVPLAAKLTEDSNGYVRKAAERAFDLRRKGASGADSRQRGLEHVVAEFELLSAIRGKAAGDRVRALAMRLYEVSVAATVHDLRGVLTSARSNLGKLQGELGESKPDSDAVRDCAGKVADRLAYLEKFVEAMGTFSQAIPPERVAARLAQVISEANEVAVDAVRLEPGRVKSSLVVDDAITVVVARHQVVAAFANVVKNAYEAVCAANDDRVGQVTISADSTTDGDVCIVVHDNGIGIKGDDLRELRTFVPGRTTKKGHGTGFGLPITQRYVAAHRGSVSLESIENVGTTVTIVLPTETQEGMNDDSEGASH